MHDCINFHHTQHHKRMRCENAGVTTAFKPAKLYCIGCRNVNSWEWNSLRNTTTWTKPNENASKSCWNSSVWINQSIGRETALPFPCCQKGEKMFCKCLSKNHSLFQLVWICLPVFNLWTKSKRSMVIISKKTQKKGYSSICGEGKFKLHAWRDFQYSYGYMIILRSAM